MKLVHWLNEEKEKGERRERGTREFTVSYTRVLEKDEPHRTKMEAE